MSDAFFGWRIRKFDTRPMGNLTRRRRTLSSPLPLPPLLPHSPPPLSLAATACARRGGGGGAQWECDPFHGASARGPSTLRTKDGPSLFLGAAKGRRILSSADPLMRDSSIREGARKKLIKIHRGEERQRKKGSEIRGGRGGISRAVLLLFVQHAASCRPPITAILCVSG